MMNIILLAPQSAGKGTQAYRLEKKYNIKHVSTGDMLRRCAMVDDSLGRSIKELIDNGKFVSDDLILDIIKDVLINDNGHNGFVFDGFPRNVNQAKLFDELLVSLNMQINNVILIDVSYDVIMKRIFGRMVCSSCGFGYNVNYDDQRPKVDGICDKCGGSLIKRSDDNCETVSFRLKTYYDTTEELIDFYNNKHLLYRVDGNDSVDKVFDDIVKIIEGDE